MGEEIENIKELYTVRRTLLEMLSDRGYIVDSEDLQEMTLDKFMKRFESGFESSEEDSHKKHYVRMSRERLFYFTQHKDDEENTIFVFFPPFVKLGLKHIKHYYKELEKENSKRAIIILKTPPLHRTGGVSAKARQAVEAMEGHGYKMEIFKERELLINVTNHELVPKHIPLTEEDKTQLFKRYKLNEKQIPRILRTDPISRYFGMNRGQVFKIVRPSETAGRYVTYRIVV